jgi:hypothetical protein
MHSWVSAPELRPVDAFDIGVVAAHASVLALGGTVDLMAEVWQAGAGFGMAVAVTADIPGVFAAFASESTAEGSHVAGSHSVAAADAGDIGRSHRPAVVASYIVDSFWNVVE